MAYATLTDLITAGLPAAALATVDNTTRQQALDDNSALADSYLGDKVQLPLTPPYDRTLVRMVCFLAAWDLLCFRGYNPTDPSDAVVYTRYNNAMKWLERVANGQARIVANQAIPVSNQPDVATNEPRGYGDLSGTGTGLNDPVAGGNWGD